MLHWIISSLWHSALTQFGIAGLVLAASIALFLYSPLPSIRHACVTTAAVCCVLLFLGPHFYVEGIRHEKAKWTAAEANARALGDAARADALRDAAAGVRDDFDDDGG